MPKTLALAKLSSTQQRLRDLQSEAVSPESIAAELQALQEQLTELEVAYLELEEQNEELGSTREELERQRHRYLQLFEEAPFGYLLTDRNGVIEEANRAAADLLRVPQDLLPGKPFFLYLSQRDRSEVRDLVQACAETPTGEVELQLRPRERNAAVPVAVAVTVAADIGGGAARAGEVRRAGKLRWIVRDISRTKAAEEALRTSE